MYFIVSNNVCVCRDAGTWLWDRWSRFPWTSSSCTCLETPSPYSPSWWCVWWHGDPSRRSCPCQPVSISVCQQSCVMIHVLSRSLLVSVWSVQAAGELESAVAAGIGVSHRKPARLRPRHLQVSINGAPPNTLLWLAGVHRAASGAWIIHEAVFIFKYTCFLTCVCFVHRDWRSWAEEWSCDTLTHSHTCCVFNMNIFNPTHPDN